MKPVVKALLGGISDYWHTREPVPSPPPGAPVSPKWPESVLLWALGQLQSARFTKSEGEPLQMAAIGVTPVVVTIAVVVLPVWSW